MGKRLDKLEELICTETIDEDEIMIKEFTYDQARESILQFLSITEGEVYPSELMIKLGIDIKLVHKVFSDLLKEEIIE